MKSRIQPRLQTRIRTAATRYRAGLMAGSALALLGLAGCHTDMWGQPKVKPQYQSDFFPDQQANRPLQPHTVDRDHFWTDSARYTGYDDNNKITDVFPFKITKEDILRGQERFNIYCSPCHGALGNGQGMIALRGFALRRQPGNYHTDQLRKAPVGHFYDVITNGYGTMYSYASRVEPDDRWRIAAYIRVLQRSQNANRSDVKDTDPRLNADAKKQIDNYTPPAVPNPVTNPSTNPNGTAPTGTGAGTTQPGHLPPAETPVPNAQPPSGRPTNGTAPNPQPGNGPADPNNPAGTGTGTIRHAPETPPDGSQTRPQAPTTNGITPPTGGSNGTSNR